MGDEHEHHQLAQSPADPARTTGVLAVAMHAGKIPDVAERVSAAWPGVCTVTLIGSRVRELPARLLPERPIPLTCSPV